MVASHPRLSFLSYASHPSDRTGFSGNLVDVIDWHLGCETGRLPFSLHFCSIPSWKNDRVSDG